MVYLIIISFLLHFVAFFIIIILAQKVNANSSIGSENDTEKLKHEIEDLLLSYTTEMKEENEKLINKLAMKKKTLDHSQRTVVTTYDRKQKEKIEKKATENRPVRQKDDEENLYVPPQVHEQEDTVEQSTTAQVLSLANQGYTAKEIAKKLNIGDGEVELLLKFHK